MGAEESTPTPRPQAPGTALQMAQGGMLVRGDEGQGAHPGDPPTPPPSPGAPVGPYLLSQHCRNPGNFPLEIAPWAFRPLGCWEAVLSNSSHKYLPRQEQLL